MTTGSPSRDGRAHGEAEEQDGVADGWRRGLAMTLGAARPEQAPHLVARMFGSSGGERLAGMDNPRRGLFAHFMHLISAIAAPCPEHAYQGRTSTLA